MRQIRKAVLSMLCQMDYQTVEALKDYATGYCRYQTVTRKKIKKALEQLESVLETDGVTYSVK